MSRRVRIHAGIVSAVSVAMLSATALTSWRAHRETGNTVFLLSQWRMVAMRVTPAEDAEAAEFDAAMKDAGESKKQPVMVVMPVVGLLDATLPVILAGGLWIVWIAWRESRLRRSEPGCPQPGESRKPLANGNNVQREDVSQTPQ